MEFRRLFDILPFQQLLYPQKVAFAYRPIRLKGGVADGQGKSSKRWLTYSTEEAIDHVQRLSAGLLELGLKKGERVGIMTYNGSPEWNFFDLAAQQAGLIVVPIHASIVQKDLRFILSDAEVKCCLFTDQALYDKLQEAKEAAPALKYLYSIEPLNDVPHWQELLRPPSAKNLATFETMRAVIHEDDLATIIYTSGTTGLPKGVMLSHKNIISNIKAVVSLVPVNCDKRVFSFLPMSHIFERMVTYFYMAVGASVYYAKRPESLLTDMASVKPHYFTCVPRFLEKLYQGIEQAVDQKGRMTRKVFRWAAALGRRYEEKRNHPPLYWLKLKTADILVYRTWRNLLGGRIEGVIVGAAALPPYLGRLFCAAGLEVREGYGLTETSPVLSFNRFEPGGVRFGTVGIPVPGVELRLESIDEQGNGEIVVRGPNVMLGYYKRPDLTNKVKTEDGWFHTGDVGRMVHKRFLQITDRKKDIFKTTSGKYIAPQHIENLIRQSTYIDQCMIIGFNRPYVVALILPDFSMLKQWCEDKDVHWTGPQFMVLNPKVQQFFDEQFIAINANLSGVERIRKFQLLHQSWSEESGELTLTSKLKRPIIAEKYSKEIEEMYDQ